MSWRKCRLMVALLASALSGLHASEMELSAHLGPFVAKHCAECHGEKKQKGDLRLDTLSRDLREPTVAIHWQDVVDALRSGEMPPEKQPRPPASDIAQIIAALDTELRTVADQARGPSRIAIRRLSHSAMDNSVFDLLGLALPLSRELPVDPDVAGFDNMAQTVAATQEFLAKVQTNARRIAAEVIVEGPDVRANRDFSVPQLGHGVNVREVGEALTVWSSKNRKNVIWPAAFVVPRLGVYRIRLTAMARDNRNDFEDGVSALAALPKQRNMTSPQLPDDAERFVSVKALPAGDVRSADGESTKGREVGRIPLTGSMAGAEIECLLEPGENIFLHYVSAARIQNPPLVKVGGKDAYVGEALYVRTLGVDGPLLPSWPPPVQTQLLGAGPGAETDAEIEDRLRVFTTRAFRRPITDEALARYTGLFRQNVQTGASRESAMRLVVEAVLCSPRFLYNRDSAAGPDAWSVASRLSYFLWNSTPDDALLSLAASGELLQPATIVAQARRMIADPKSDRFVTDFTAQWLQLKKVGAMQPDPKLFPSYDKSLEIAMRRETEAFFSEILHANLPVRTFLESDFAMLNERLARHYGISGVEGDAIRRVALPVGSPRGGLLAQAAMLTITSNGSRTSPVVRGVWVLENLLDSPPSPPPANIEPLEPDVRGATTIREMMAKHRKIETCSDCHSRIDPYGFALENFDAIGAWRADYSAPRTKNANDGATVPKVLIDASGVLPDGTAFNDYFEMRAAFALKTDRFGRALASKLFAHAVGHQPDLSERRALERLVGENLAAGGYFADLIVALCASDLFLGKTNTPRAFPQ